MQTVYKYGPIQPNDYFELDLPEGAQILTVAEQHGEVYLWALVVTENAPETRRFRWAGTGHRLTEDESGLRFISTFQMSGGALVFHVFEVL